MVGAAVRVSEIFLVRTCMSGVPEAAIRSGNIPLR